MIRLSVATVFLMLVSLLASSQELVGGFRQSYFSGREDYYSNVYAIATPSHKKGAAMIRVHGETVIDRIYIVVDELDLKAFINAFESCRIQFLSKERIDVNYFPPVSVMWRDRKRHVWLEAFGYLMIPDVYYEGSKGYFSLTGNVRCNFESDRKSGEYFIILDGPEEIDAALRVLKSDKLHTAIIHAPMTLHPFE